MDRLSLYHKTVDILYAAYFNDTLRHNKCTACAVGNMVAANMGIEMNIDLENGAIYWANCSPQWDNVFMTAQNKQWFNVDGYQGEAKRQIDSTGYSVVELAAIERRFESADRGNSDEDYMFNGLVDVLETLKQIHGIEDNEPEVKRFREHHETKLLQQA